MITCGLSFKQQCEKSLYPPWVCDSYRFVIDEERKTQYKSISPTELQHTTTSSELGSNKGNPG